MTVQQTWSPARVAWNSERMSAWRGVQEVQISQMQQETNPKHKEIHHTKPCKKPHTTPNKRDNSPAFWGRCFARRRILQRISWGLGGLGLEMQHGLECLSKTPVLVNGNHGEMWFLGWKTLQTDWSKWQTLVKQAGAWLSWSNRLKSRPLFSFVSLGFSPCSSFSSAAALRRKAPHPAEVAKLDVAMNARHLKWALELGGGGEEEVCVVCWFLSWFAFDTWCISLPARLRVYRTCLFCCHLFPWVKRSR